MFNCLCDVNAENSANLRRNRALLRRFPLSIYWSSLARHFEQCGAFLSQVVSPPLLASGTARHAPSIRQPTPCLHTWLLWRSSSSFLPPAYATCYLLMIRHRHQPCIASAAPLALFADPIGGILLAINLRPSSATRDLRGRRRHFTTATSTHGEFKRDLG